MAASWVCRLKQKYSHVLLCTTAPRLLAAPSQEMPYAVRLCSYRDGALRPTWRAALGCNKSFIGIPWTHATLVESSICVLLPGSTGSIVPVHRYYGALPKS